VSLRLRRHLRPPAQLQRLLWACVLWTLAGWSPAADLTAAGAVAQSQPVTVFSLRVIAPDEVQALLLAHLELLRYQQLQDLDETELQRLVQDARTQVRELLATRGHFSPQVQMSLQAGPPAGPAWNIVIEAEPGPAATVNQVDLNFSGDILGDQALSRRQELQQQWSLPAGSRFTQQAWDRAKADSLRQLQQTAYPRARLLGSEARVDTATHQVHLQIHLDSGPHVQLGPVVVSGQDRYGTEQVTRLAQLLQGQEYRQSDLLEAQQRLVASGYYDAVFVSLDPDGLPQANPVLIELREAPRRKWVLGLGVRSESGPRLSLEYLHHRLPWLDWRATFKAALDRSQQTFGLDLLEPPDPKLWRRTAAVHFDRIDYTGYALHTQRLRAGRVRLSESLDQSWYVQHDRAQRSGLINDREDAVSAHLALTRRQFNQLPFPDQGWGLGLELGAGLSLGAQPEPYGRWLVRALRVQALRQGASRLALRAQLGGVLSRRPEDLPSSQLFLAGGEQSVRGYAPGSIGVQVRDGVVVAGRYLATGTLEWQWPLGWLQSGGPWEGVLFADAGAVANSASELQVRSAWGVGARWRSPVGPLQIDLAHALQENRWRLHLSVGFKF
jgi:translocation and assembly module TamA